MINYKLHFIRHGITQGNLDGKYIGATDMHVCKEGFEALQNLKDNYEYPRVEAVYSSPLTRCIQTSDFFYPDSMLTIVEDLREWNFGDFEGKTIDELKLTPEFIDWMNASMLTAPPNGESGTDVKVRLTCAINSIFADMMKEKITSAAVVTHGGIIMTLLSQFAVPKDPEKRWLTENGRGYTVIMTPQMWMRDGGFEVFDIIPNGSEPMDISSMDRLSWEDEEYE